MNILLIAPRYYPIFNKDNKGGIESLERIYLTYNETKNDRFVVYSPKIANDDYDHEALNNTTFRIVDQTKLQYKIVKIIYSIKRRLRHSCNNENYIRIVAKDIKRRKEQNKYDLIIFENGEQDIPIFRKLIKTKTKIVLHLHNDYVNKNIKNSKQIIDSCDEVWAVSDFISKRIAEVKKTNIKTIPNAINLDARKIDNNEVGKISRKYNAANNIIFLYVGRLLKVKGIIELLDAYDKYSKINEHSALLIIGATDGGNEGKAIQKIVNRYTSKNRSIHHIGYVKPASLPNYQMVADYQVIPSMWEEAFGLVVLEAMAANLNIIATVSGAIPEIGKDKIEYVSRDNIVGDLVEKMRSAAKGKKPDGYYSAIMNEYTKEMFCERVYGALHEK